MGDHGSERKDSVAKQNPVRSVLNGGDRPHKDLARFLQCTQMPHSRVKKFLPIPAWALRFSQSPPTLSMGFTKTIKSTLGSSHCTHYNHYWIWAAPGRGPYSSKTQKSKVQMNHSLHKADALIPVNHRELQLHFNSKCSSSKAKTNVVHQRNNRKT
jgi:hypothetical protein